MSFSRRCTATATPDPASCTPRSFLRTTRSSPPYTQQLLDGPNVTNIVLQDLYPGLPAGHLGVVLSPQVWDVVLDALASNSQANPLLETDELVA